MADGLLLPASLARGRRVAARPPRARPRRPRALRPRGVAVGCDPRQPVGLHGRPKAGDNGYDVGRKVTGCKRHILTDTDGRLLAVRVHGADVQDRDGGKLPLKASRQRFPFVVRVFADGGYAGRLVDWAADKTHISLEIIRRGAPTRTFEVLTAPLGRRAHLHLNLQEPAPRPRLRAAHRRRRIPHHHRRFRHFATAVGMIRLPSQTRS